MGRGLRSGKVGRGGRGGEVDDEDWVREGGGVG